MALNGIKGIMSILFPLITFPYVSRILGRSNIGRYNFSLSIINYFILLSGLGINAYAIREGAQIRDNRRKFERFASEMYSINFGATIISYILLGILLLIIPKFQGYMSLLIILSLQIGLKTIGIEWLYSIYEDYAYIMFRSIFFQLLSLILLFTLVRSESDVNMYAVVTVMSASGCNILNLLYAKKYCKIRLTKNIEWKRHMRPILLLFAMTVTVTIYVSSDITLLGFLCNDITVGIYTVSTKVYSIIKTLLSAILTVSIPRLSALIGEKKKDEFNIVAEDIYKTLLTFVLPVIVGIIVLRKEIVLILSGQEYIGAESSLVLLSIALFFCMGAWYWGQCILVPVKKEATVFKVTVVSASVNIVLNLVMIPIWEENAAALTTIIAEGISFLCCYLQGRRYVEIQKIKIILIKIMTGCIPIFILYIFVNHYFILPMVINTVLIISVSIILYFVVEILMKNEVIWDIISRRKTLQ